MRVRLIFLLILGGPLSGYRYVSENLKKQGNVSGAKWYSFLAILGTLFNYFILMIVWNRLEGFKSIIEQNIGLGTALGYSFLIILHAVWTLAFALWNWFSKSKRFEYPEKTDSLIRHALTGFLVAIAFFIFGPFRFTFLTILVLPHFYIFYRLKMITRSNQKRKILGGILVFLILSFPIGQYLYTEWNNVFSIFIVRLGYYYLPVILYFLLGLLLFDIVYLLSRLFFNSLRLSDHSPVFHRTAFTLIFACILGIVVWGSWNFNTPRYTSYDLTMDKKSSELESLRIAIASDLHLGEITSEHFVEKLVEKLNKTNADLILFPGDIMETGNMTKKMTRFTQLLSTVTAPYGVYASTGNHEYYGSFDEKIQLIKNSGMDVLLDTTVIFSNKFLLVARNDVHDPSRKSLNMLLPEKAHLPVLVMDHRALNLQALADEGVDLQVSGHTHNGQLFPFQWITKNIYELSWGHKEVDGSHFIVSAGAQGWGPQVRTSAYSEIVIANIVFK